MSQHSARSHSYKLKRAAVLAASDICWLCGHGGADTVDHVIPRSVAKDDSEHNLRPAHGVIGCPTCGRKCNQSRGNGRVAVKRKPRRRVAVPVTLNNSRNW